MRGLGFPNDGVIVIRAKRHRVHKIPQSRCRAESGLGHQWRVFLYNSPISGSIPKISANAIITALRAVGQSTKNIYFSGVNRFAAPNRDASRPDVLASLHHSNLLSDGEKFGRNLGAKSLFYRPKIGT